MMKNRVDEIYQKAVTPEQFSKEYCLYLGELLSKLNYSQVAEVIKLFIKTRNTKKKIIFIGNGGSAATSSHFANDIGYGNRAYDFPFRAIALTDNNAIITALANDEGYEHIFRIQLQNIMEEGDLIVAISASGNSPNLLRAIEYAKSKKNFTIGLLGFDGGALKKMCDLSLVVETVKGEYGPVEDIHMVLDHLISSYLNRYVKEAKI